MLYSLVLILNLNSFLNTDFCLFIVNRIVLLRRSRLCPFSTKDSSSSSSLRARCFQSHTAARRTGSCLSSCELLLPPNTFFCSLRFLKSFSNGVRKAYSRVRRHGPWSSFCGSSQAVIRLVCCRVSCLFSSFYFTFLASLNRETGSRSTEKRINYVTYRVAPFTHLSHHQLHRGAWKKKIIERKI